MDGYDYQPGKALPLSPRTVLPPSPPSASPPKIESPRASLDGLGYDDGDSSPRQRRVADGLNVLMTEANALKRLALFYDEDPAAQAQFSKAVETIAWSQAAGSKLVVTGVGKSGHIGRKLVSTFQSLGVPAVFLHPTEALHGDLGLVGRGDTLMFVSFSGKTPELLLLLPHLPASMRVVVLTSHTRRDACELLGARPGGVLLPAPIPEPETCSFGVAAPTTSTTVALALGDALAIATAKELHRDDVPSVFARHHPGGSIGASLK
ncbi:hypothetical protein ACO1O0_002116 [Amphichorda felina]